MARLTALDKELAFVNRHIGTVIRRRRKRLGITVKALAKKLDTSPSSIVKYERGAIRISALKLCQFAVVLRMPVNVFLFDVDDHVRDRWKDVTGEEPKRHKDHWHVMSDGVHTQ